MAIESPEHAPAKEYVQSKLLAADGFWFFVDPNGSKAEQRAFVRTFTALPERMQQQLQTMITADTHLQQRFTSSARIRGDIDLYTPEECYHLQYGNHGHTDISLTAHLDAPCAFTLDYHRSDGQKEIIAVVSFLPSLQNRTLYIDQIQGGAGFKHQSSQEARRIRFKLHNPEDALVAEVVALAQQQGLSYIAIRKTAANKYKTVTGKTEQGKESLYDRTIRTLHLVQTGETAEHAIFALHQEKK